MFTVLTTKCNSQRTRKTIQLNAANYIRIQIIFITSGETSYCTMQQRQIIGLIISALSSVASLSSAFGWISMMSVIEQQTASSIRPSFAAFVTTRTQFVATCMRFIELGVSSIPVFEVKIVHVISNFENGH